MKAGGDAVGQADLAGPAGDEEGLVEAVHEKVAGRCKPFTCSLTANLPRQLPTHN